jgi:hypothetical protein
LNKGLQNNPYPYFLGEKGLIFFLINKLWAIKKNASNKLNGNTKI